MWGQSQKLCPCRGKIEAGKSCVTWDFLIEDIKTELVPTYEKDSHGDFKEAPGIHYNFPLLVFPLHMNIRNGIAAAGIGKVG